MSSSSSELLPPLETITPDNRGPALTIVAFIFLFVTLIVVVVKYGSTLYSKTVSFSTDVPLWIALVIAFIQSLLTQFAVDNGLGRHAHSLSADEFSKYNKFTYAAQLLVILVLSHSKVSTCRLIYRITPGQHIRQASMIVVIIVGLWTVFALFATALQCRPPWEYLPSQCAAEGAVAYPIIVINIFTNLALVFIPLIMLWNVQMAFQKRLQIIASFCVRLVVAAVSIIELVYLPTYLHSIDPTWTIVNVDICNELTMYLSIIAACMPSIYRILSSLKSGLNDIHMPDIELSTIHGATGSKAKSRDQAGSSSRARRHSTMFPGFRATDLFSRDDNMTQNGLYTMQTNGFRRDRDGAESTESTQWLTEENQPPISGVRKTVEVCVEVHDNHS
ncbi:integral membrane protein [Aspergillus sclerotioniger CBS 115572]|uniref:Integral membrane protein n=1 Tax=Aspergillus sclerotioniger CBS 115572 TaxID=1450535 RepID=A0A317W174_9EURO|nr:integral membrane protein [Aspergillus sclerotioniger CBS 115572]PWY80394.1 integral membrane protein [Aspergillus sclerotioniger CBS 115572]